MPDPVADRAPGLAADLERVLRGWAAPDPEQAALREAYLAHLARHPDAVHRDGPPAHFTVGCVVLDESLSQVLLTLHAKAGRWFQLGGHLERDDPDVLAAARREAVEESGLGERDLTLHPDPVQLDPHDLPGAFGRCSAHLDVRYAAVVRAGCEPVRSEESLDLAWWPVEALPAATAGELAPLVDAARSVLGSRTRG